MKISREDAQRLFDEFTAELTRLSRRTGVLLEGLESIYLTVPCKTIDLTYTNDGVCEGENGEYEAQLF